MAWISNSLSAYLYLWGWRDSLELLFFVGMFYATTKWLDKDKTKHLVGYIYCYCSMLFGAYCLHLPIVCSFLLMYGPVIAIICILMHQDLLQKHLITPIKIVPAHIETDWIDDLMQAFLITMNSKNSILCIIQNKNDLRNILTTSYELNTPITKNILLTLVESKLFDHKAMIHITSTGTLLGINSHWVHHGQDTWQTATAVITQNDALAIRGNPEHNTFDVALHNSITENLTSTQCRNIIRQYIQTKQIHQTKATSKNKDNLHEANNH